VAKDSHLHGGADLLCLPQMAAIMRADNQYSSANRKAQPPDKRILEANAVQIERVCFMDE
jgi:hypothetical protein